MQKSNPLGLLIVVGLLAVASWWLLGGPGGPDAGPAPAGGPEPGGSAPAKAPIDGAAGALPATEGTEPEQNRVTVATPSVADGAAIVGRVVDDGGSPVVAAEVSGGTQDWSQFADLDPSSLDPETALERVRALRQQRQTTTTDDDGRFRLAMAGNSSARNVNLQVSARGFRLLHKDAQRPADKDVDVGALTLLRGAVVSGRVVDRSGRPVADAVVRRSDRREGGGLEELFAFEAAVAFADAVDVGGDQAKTDAEGRFELQHVEPGEFALRARHAEHPPALRSGLSVPAGQTLTGVEVVLEPGATIEGKLLGAPADLKNLRVLAATRRNRDRQPEGEQARFVTFLGEAGEMIADAGFDAGERSSKVAADGSFTLRGLAVGTVYRVWATQRGRGLAGGAVCSQRVEVQSGTNSVELRYEAGVTVTFRVVAAGGDRPIEELWVRDRLAGGGGIGDMIAGGLPGGGGKRVFPDGLVTIPNLRPKDKQTLSVTVEALGFARFDKKDIALPRVGTVDLGTVRLEPAPVVHVLVLGLADGQPVANARVRLQSPRRPGRQVGGEAGMFFELAEGAEGIVGAGGRGTTSGRTDDQGRCVLNALPGEQVVTVTSDQFATYSSEPFTPAERGETAHTARLYRGGTVAVQALADDGKPLAEARVEHRSPSGQRDSRSADKEGKVDFERLAPGTHQFRLGGRGRTAELMFAFEQNPAAAPSEPGWESVVVEELGRAEVQLTKSPTASLSGIVRENGLPLADARVAFLAGPGGPAASGPREQLLEMAGQFEGGLGGRRGRGSGRTDDQGRYELKELQEGQHRLRITHQKRSMPAEVSVFLRLGANTFDVDLQTSTLRGVVRDPDGKPVAGVSVSVGPPTAAPTGPRPSVRVEGAPGVAGELAQAVEAMAPGLAGGGRNTVRTGDDGSFELRGVQPDKKLVVRATKKGFAPAATAAIEVAPGQTRDGVDLQLLTGGAIRVRSAGAAPFTAVQAIWAGEQPNDFPGAVQVLQNGTTLFEGLRPGRWQLRVMAAANQGQPPTFVEVLAGQTIEVTL